MALPPLEPGNALIASTLNNAFSGTTYDLSHVGEDMIRARSLNMDQFESQVVHFDSGSSQKEIADTVMHAYTALYVDMNTWGANTHIDPAGGGCGTPLTLDLGAIYDNTTPELAGVLIELDTSIAMLRDEAGAPDPASDFLAAFVILTSPDAVTWTSVKHSYGVERGVTFVGSVSIQSRNPYIPVALRGLITGDLLQTNPVRYVRGAVALVDRDGGAPKSPVVRLRGTVLSAVPFRGASV